MMWGFKNAWVQVRHCKWSKISNETLDQHVRHYAVAVSNNFKRCNNAQEHRDML
ncbi:hypothetical protein TNCT_578981, partial [Trichonephila clavata]